MSSPPRIKAARVWAAARSALGSLLGSQLKWQMMHSLGEHASHMDTRLFTDSKHTRGDRKKHNFEPGVSPLASGYRGPQRFNQIFSKRVVFVACLITQEWKKVLCSLYVHVVWLLTCKRSKSLLLNSVADISSS